MYYLSKGYRDEIKSSAKLILSAQELHNIKVNGSPEEMIEHLNKLSPDYQMMTDAEVKLKYIGFISDYFYTLKEVRKLKIKEIENIS